MSKTAAYVEATEAEDVPWSGPEAIPSRDDQPEQLSGPQKRAAKRGMDIVLALAAILVLAPVWLLISLLIKVDSKGSILFRQRRIGREAEAFDMLKFRTMVDDADQRKHEIQHLNEAAPGLFKIRDDPRLTRFGRFLRSTSLDELPQLLQVFTGEMSLVGPRPLIPEEDTLIEGNYRDRLSMRPGMTGPWQVAGASRVPLDKMVALDLEYTRNHSLWGDLKLLLGTAKHVLYRRGI